MRVHSHSRPDPTLGRFQRGRLLALANSHVDPRRRAHNCGFLLLSRRGQCRVIPPRKVCANYSAYPFSLSSILFLFHATFTIVREKTRICKIRTLSFGTLCNIWGRMSSSTYIIFCRNESLKLVFGMNIYIGTNEWNYQGFDSKFESIFIELVVDSRG